jgi:dolichol kinase
MRDLLLALGWMGVLGAGLWLVAVLRRARVPSTYTRDLVHVGAGSWVLGWPWWSGWLVPVSIPIVAALATTALPALHTRAARRVRDALSGDDETWSGVAVYTMSSAIFTVLAFADARVPAAGALLALSLGDGIGGAVGRRFGAHFFQVPWSKRKSLEGSATVAALSTIAVLIVTLRFGEPVRPFVVGAAGAIAAIVEAASPRGSDNFAVPLAVWAVLRLLG